MQSATLQGTIYVLVDTTSSESGTLQTGISLSEAACSVLPNQPDP